MSAVTDRSARAPSWAASTRSAYAVVAALLLVAAVLTAGWSWPLWVFAIAPDLPLLGGGGRGLQQGQLHRRVVPFYNATHRLIGPLALSCAGAIVLAAGGGSTAWLVAGLAWGVHVCADRALGYRLRGRDGFMR